MKPCEKDLYYSSPVTGELTKNDVPLMLTCTPVLVQAVKQTNKQIVINLRHNDARVVLL